MILSIILNLIVGREMRSQKYILGLYKPTLWLVETPPPPTKQHQKEVPGRGPIYHLIFLADELFQAITYRKEWLCQICRKSAKNSEF